MIHAIVSVDPTPLIAILKTDEQIRPALVQYMTRSQRQRPDALPVAVDADLIHRQVSLDCITGRTAQ